MKIFISYRRDDSRASAGRLYQSFEAKFSADLLYKDVDNIRYGRDFRIEIGKAIDDSFALVAVIGPNWLGKRNGGSRLQDANDNVRIEIERAFARRIPIFPVLVDGAEIPSADELPLEIRDLAYINAASLDHDTWQRDVRPLVDAIAAEKSAAENAAAEKAAAEKAAAEKAAEKAAAEKAAEKAAAEKAAAEKAAEKAAAEKAAEKAAAEKAAAAKAAAAKTAAKAAAAKTAEKAAAEKAAEKAAAEKAAAEKAAEKAAAEKAAEKAAAEKAAAAKTAEKAAAEKAAAEMAAARWAEFRLPDGHLFESAVAGASDFYLAPLIPRPVLNNAWTHYGIQPYDAVILLLDTTVFGSAKTGVAFCEFAVYCNNGLTVKTQTRKPTLKYSEMVGMSVSRGDHQVTVGDKIFNTYAQGASTGYSGSEVLEQVFLEIQRFFKNR